MGEWPKLIMVCSECGVLVDDDRDYGLGPAKGCPSERKCGTFPPGSGMVELPGVRDVSVIPAAEAEALREALREIAGLADHHDLISCQNIARAALSASEGRGLSDG